ncbi:unnamed protein product [Urochloa humidicola]
MPACVPEALKWTTTRFPPCSVSPRHRRQTVILPWQQTVWCSLVQLCRQNCRGELYIHQEHHGGKLNRMF